MFSIIFSETVYTEDVLEKHKGLFIFNIVQFGGGGSYAIYYNRVRGDMIWAQFVLCSVFSLKKRWRGRGSANLHCITGWEDGVWNGPDLYYVINEQPLRSNK